MQRLMRIMTELNHPDYFFPSIKREPSGDKLRCSHVHGRHRIRQIFIFESAGCWKEHAGGEQSTGSVFTGYKKELLVWLTAQ